MENVGKTDVFRGSFSQIVEIPHGLIQPDWGL